MAIKNKIKKEVLDINKEVRNKLAGYIVAGLGLVAGLAWNDAIKSMIEYFFPLEENSLMAKFIYALLITLFVVLISVYTVRILKGKETKTEEKNG